MCRAEQLIGRLTPAERRSLRSMAHAPFPEPVPAAHEEALIGLGLAELVCGQAGLTATGRRAVALIGGWEQAREAAV